MKRLVITSNSSWYLYNFRFELLQKLKKKYSIFLICPKDEYSNYLQKFFSCEFLNFDRYSTNIISEIIILLKFMYKYSKIKPNLVLSFTNKANLYSSICSNFYKVPHISTVSGMGWFNNNNLLNKLLKKFLKFTLKKNAAIFLQNEKDFKEFIKINNNIILTNGSGVNLNKFKFTQNKKKLVSFLFFGRIMKSKGIIEYINIAKIYRNYFKFYIVGNIDTSEKKITNSYLKNLKKFKISYMSHSMKINELMKQVDVVISPSTYNEGLPKTLLEAFACGKLVIVNEKNPFKKYIKNFVNGFIYNSKNYRSINVYMNYLMNIDKKKIFECGKLNRLIAKNNFCSKRNNDIYLNEIEKKI